MALCFRLVFPVSEPVGHGKHQTGREKQNVFPQQGRDGVKREEIGPPMSLSSLCPSCPTPKAAGPAEPAISLRQERETKAEHGPKAVQEWGVRAAVKVPLSTFPTPLLLLLSPALTEPHKPAQSSAGTPSAHSPSLQLLKP